MTALAYALIAAAASLTAALPHYAPRTWYAAIRLAGRPQGQGGLAGRGTRVAVLLRPCGRRIAPPRTPPRWRASRGRHWPCPGPRGGCAAHPRYGARPSGSSRGGRPWWAPCRLRAPSWRSHPPVGLGGAPPAAGVPGAAIHPKAAPAQPARGRPGHRAAPELGAQYRQAPRPPPCPARRSARGGGADPAILAGAAAALSPAPLVPVGGIPRPMPRQHSGVLFGAGRAPARYPAALVPPSRVAAFHGAVLGQGVFRGKPLAALPAAHVQYGADLPVDPGPAPLAVVGSVVAVLRERAPAQPAR